MDSNPSCTTIESLVGQQFRYGLKSPDVDLYDLGFGRDVVFVNANGKRQEACQFTLHLVCGIFAYWKDGRKDEFYGNTPPLVFQKSIQGLIGEKVRRVALSDKNDLWLDLGQCNIVIVTLDSDDESWRLFTPGLDAPHLVASNMALYQE